MKLRSTLYSDSSTDLRKGLVYVVILVLSLFTNFQTSSAFSFAILLQGLSNIDNFWDFVNDRYICKPLRRMVRFLIVVSVLGILLASLNLMKPAIVFENPDYGICIKIIALITVAFPLAILTVDYILNEQIEDQEGRE